MQQIDVEALNKPELKQVLKASLREIDTLRGSVARLLRSGNSTPAARPRCHTDDFVPSGWTDQHGINIPRSDGIFESATAWVRVAHGVITGAGLKNQSILSLMVSLRLLDEGEERSSMLYTDWKSAFLAGVDPVKWTAERGRGDPEAWGKEDRYSKLLHRVDQDCLFAMDAIVAVKPKAKHLAAFTNNQPKFVDALGVVVRAIRDINREAEAALEEIRQPVANSQS